MTASPLNKISYDLAIEVIKLSRFLHSQYEKILSEQLFKNGTAIALLIQEAPLQVKKSKTEYKLKKAAEKTMKTKYWLGLLKDSKIIKDDVYLPLLDTCERIENLLKEELTNSSS